MSMSDESPIMPAAVSPAAPGLELLQALGWYAREVIEIEHLFARVTVKRRRNLARPVKRRRSAFRDPVLCYDFLAMAWLGVTRLSQIEPRLERRGDLADALGLPRFCDHTTAHNFLNAFHVTHLRQLDAANARLLREHGSALAQRTPILDLDAAERRVRRAGRRRARTYRWAVAFSAGEALAQSLQADGDGWLPAVQQTLAEARHLLSAKPRLVRLSGPCVTQDVLRELVRQRLPYLAEAPWSVVRASHPPAPERARWIAIGPDTRALDLGAALAPYHARHWTRAVLIERGGAGTGRPPERLGLATSLLHDPIPALACLSASGSRIRSFFAHPRWPLADGKLPSHDPRGNAAWLRLAAIAANVLRLFARQLAGEWTPARLHERLRAIAQHKG